MRATVRDASSAPWQPVALPVQRGAAAALTWVRSSRTGLLALSLAMGAAAGVGAIVFRWLIVAFTRVLSGHTDYSAAGHAAHPGLPGLGRWFVVLAPVVAGLVYGPLVYFFAREARGHGVPEVMYAVARRGGRIAPQVAVVKALASALCIGGGGSVGREGPIVQIGSALGSALGRVVQVTEARVRVLVACGAAGGIAATFNAPLAGVFFAMELILRDFTAQSFGMVVLSSVTASVVARSVLGDAPFLQLPAFTVDHLGQYLLFALLGVVAGVVGVGFTRILYVIEDACDWLWRGPEWLRPAVGGIALGLLLLVLPQMYGVGYPVLEGSVVGRYALGFLVLLMVGKIVATSLTIGIGGSGGVFAPSLFIGAMLGSAFGAAAHLLMPGVAGPAGAYGLIGMGAVFAGAARAPITAVIIMFELTGEYSIILPLMAAIVLATGVSHRLSRDTIYTLKLRRRGVDLDAATPATGFGAVAVREVMTSAGEPLRDSLPLLDAAQALESAPHGQLPVVDGDGRWRGVVTDRVVAQVLADPDLQARTVADVVEVPETVSPDQPLAEALAVVSGGEGAVPVIDPAQQQVVGWFNAHSALAALVARQR